MPFALNLYHNQIGADGARSAPLPAARRMLYADGHKPPDRVLPSML